ncbi:Txe/YoeB family addiction module toxin [Pedobacter arcticus]|uniref:Txe/YoeB family addiction module toxin n=1 Tax=Pedobacter arcticus TaxID=752140 RepID=UPI0003093881|nr:Txe/YoeB family addiction module toxin [Pedobacter arcticus]
MAKFEIVLTEKANKDLQVIRKSGNKATINKIDKIFLELEEHPRTGTGKVEALKDNLSGYWSRRLNQKDRLIYKIEDEIVIVTVISAQGHYSDK